MEIDSELLDCKNLMTKMRDCPSKNMIKRKAARLLQRKKIFRNHVQSLRMNSLKMRQDETVLKGVQATTAAPKIKKKNLISEKLSFWYKKMIKQSE